MATITRDVGIANRVAAYSSLLALKEAAGQERAVGSAAFAAGRFELPGLMRFSNLVAAQGKNGGFDKQLRIKHLEIMRHGLFLSRQGGVSSFGGAIVALATIKLFLGGQNDRNALHCPFGAIDRRQLRVLIPHLG